MSITMHKFFRTKEMILGGSVKLLEDTVKIAILQPGFTYDKSMVRFSDISGLEIDQTLYYQTGGIEVEGKTIATDSDGKAEFTIDTVTYDRINTSIKTIVMYAETTAYGIENPMLAYGEFSSILEFYNSAFVLSWPYPIFRW